MGYANSHSKVAPSRRLSKEQLREIFLKFDTNKDQLLSRSELKTAFSYLGSNFPGYRATQVVTYVDDNGDGHIDSEELEDLISHAYKLGYTVK